MSIMRLSGSLMQGYFKTGVPKSIQEHRQSRIAQKKPSSVGGSYSNTGSTCVLAN